MKLIGKSSTRKIYCKLSVLFDISHSWSLQWNQNTKTTKLQSPPSVPWVQWNPRPDWRQTWESRSLRSGFAGHRPSSAAISFDRGWYVDDVDKNPFALEGQTTPLILQKDVWNRLIYTRKDQQTKCRSRDQDDLYQESTNYTINNANAKHQKHSWRHHGK